MRESRFPCDQRQLSRNATSAGVDRLGQPEAVSQGERHLLETRWVESGIGPRHPAAGEGLGEASGELAIPGRGAGMERSHVCRHWALEGVLGTAGVGRLEEHAFL